MTIELYMNSSPMNYVNKQISLVDTLTGTLREPASLTDPTITIHRSSPTGFNFVFIPDFSRYYYLSGVTVTNADLISISLHVDVLMTYKAQVQAASGVIRRQESLSNDNLYLNDDLFKAYSNPKFKTLPFPNSFSSTSFILALAGNGQTIVE